MLANPNLLTLLRCPTPNQANFHTLVNSRSSTSSSMTDSQSTDHSFSSSFLDVQLLSQLTLPHWSKSWLARSWASRKGCKESGCTKPPKSDLRKESSAQNIRPGAPNGPNLKDLAVPTPNARTKRTCVKSQNVQNFSNQSCVKSHVQNLSPSAQMCTNFGDPKRCKMKWTHRHSRPQSPKVRTNQIV